MHLERAEFRKLRENKAGKNGEEPQYFCSFSSFLSLQAAFLSSRFGLLSQIFVLDQHWADWSQIQPVIPSIPVLKRNDGLEKNTQGRLFRPSSDWMLHKGKIPRICFPKIPTSFNLLMELAVPHLSVSILFFQFFPDTGNLFRVIPGFI